MRRFSRMFGVLTVALLAGGVLAAQAQPQLAGTWVLDPAQSQFPKHEGKRDHDAGGAAQRGDVRLTVEQQGNVLKVTRTMARGDQQHAVTQTYAVDGTEHAQTGHRGSNVVTKAAYDGDRLVVNTSHTMKGRDGGERTMSRHSVWSVSPDGKVLTIETTMKSPRGDRNMKTVYNRA